MTEAQTAATEQEQTLENRAESTENPLQQERDEWHDKALRLAAELDNLKKRTTKEVQDIRQFAVTDFARSMLDVQDNLERATSAMSIPETTDPAEADHINQLTSMKQGVEMVQTQLQQTLTRFGVEKFDSVGEKLNPERHQVMQQVDSDQESDTVVQEHQPGYTIHSRLLRPALVVTAK